MEFRHTPDGQIYVDGFSMTLAEFLALEPGYPGISGEAVGFEYFAGEKHWAYKAKGGAIDGPGPVDEVLLDGYIANRAVYEAALFPAPLPPPPPPKTDDEMAADLLNAGPVRQALGDVMFDLETRLAALESMPAPARSDIDAKLHAAVKARINPV
ncbi:MAG: hypothetical protein HQ494_08930 [Rhodospirillales bacterium]|nr:hypothetical protein [Rhodospirillales bacterium]